MDLRDYSRVGDAVTVPNLVAIQTESYKRFLQLDAAAEKRTNSGLEAILRESFPILSYDGSARLEYISYELGRPRYTPDECRRLGLTYGRPLSITTRYAGPEPITEPVYLGDLPVMMGGGEFIINGAERVIVSQLHRSPGVDFEVQTHATGKKLHSCRIIPERGSWIELSVSKKDVLSVKIDQSGKFAATTLLRALDKKYGTTEDLLRIFYKTETMKLKSKPDYKKLVGMVAVGALVNAGTGEIIVESGGVIDETAVQFIEASNLESIEVVPAVEDPLILNTIAEDRAHTYTEALERIYKRLRPGNPFQLGRAEQLFRERFFDPNRYRLGRVGRFRLNRKFNQTISEHEMILRPDDFINAVKYLIHLRTTGATRTPGVSSGIDDIDHLGNRRVRTIDELAGDEVRKGLLKLRRTAQERMSTKEPKGLSPRTLINPRTVSTSIDFFYGRSELSQVVDQVNPLAQLTHERRLSALGPGGLNRKRAGFEVRDVHTSHYGRICPIETPEGTNIGLIVSLSIFAEIDDYGFLVTPYRKVRKVREADAGKLDEIQTKLAETEGEKRETERQQQVVATDLARSQKTWADFETKSNEIRRTLSAEEGLCKKADARCTGFERDLAEAEAEKKKATAERQECEREVKRDKSPLQKALETNRYNEIFLEWEETDVLKQQQSQGESGYHRKLDRDAEQAGQNFRKRAKEAKDSGKEGGYLEKAELLDIMNWKYYGLRGPSGSGAEKAITAVKGLKEADVKKLTLSAFKHIGGKDNPSIPELVDAFLNLCKKYRKMKIPGVGSGAASSIVAFCYPKYGAVIDVHVRHVMDRKAKLQYTGKDYKECLETLSTIGKALEPVVTPRAIDRAVFAAGWLKVATRKNDDQLKKIAEKTDTTLDQVISDAKDDFAAVNQAYKTLALLEKAENKELVAQNNLANRKTELATAEQEKKTLEKKCGILEEQIRDLDAGLRESKKESARLETERGRLDEEKERVESRITNLRRQVSDISARSGKPIVTDEIEKLRADQEDDANIAPADVPTDKSGRFVEELVMARAKGEFKLVPAAEIDYVDVSPKQLVGISAALIPFLEHDDANRALMGSNMQRQAVPLLTTETPLVSTGLEEPVARHSGMVITAEEPGTVRRVSADEIVVDNRIYHLRKFAGLSSRTCLNQKPIVAEGEHVKKGQVIADGAATKDGKLALGRNVLVAFMPFDGANYEDAILLSEKLVKEDVYTSIHIDEFEIEVRETKLGREEFTRDIPNVPERSLKNLDDTGIIRVGTRVRPGDILVGKVAPKSKTELSPEEKLLHAIFGRAGEDVKNESLDVPSGVEGIVIDAQKFSRKAQLSGEARATDRTQIKKIEREADKAVIVEFRRMIEAVALAARGTIVDGDTGQRLANLDDWSDEEILELEERLDPENLLVVVPGGPRKGQKINPKARREFDIFQERIDGTKDEKDRRVSQLKRGDELPPGVLEMVKVYVATKRSLSVGDKMAGRHGNKGVIARILPEEDMPYLEDGTPVEIVLNPLGVPSRMNLGQILETHLGWAAKIMGYEVISPVFDGATEAQIRDALAEAGLPPSGKARLYDGRSGTPFDQEVTVGYMYVLKLEHLVDDKIHARATGPYSLITQQPLGGKARSGGQRFGEMEVWALEAYGAAHILQELLTVKSDDVEGRTRIYEAMVKGENTLQAGTPVSFDVLVNELKGLGLNIRLEKKK